MRAFLLFIFLGCVGWAGPQVVVSVAPQKALVERIAGESVDVAILVPAGASPHTYEPSTRQLMQVREGKVWFRIGEGFEMLVARSLNREMRVVDLREERDPHIWLSPRLLRKQAAVIAQVLADVWPENQELYERNLRDVVQELQELDEEIAELAKQSTREVVLVSHPAFGYFCRDYGLQQMSIEVHGKEPSPKQLALLLQKARHLGIDRVFVQPQYNPKGAERVAEELGAATTVVDPYLENVFENLRTIAHAFYQ